MSAGSGFPQKAAACVVSELLRRIPYKVTLVSLISIDAETTPHLKISPREHIVCYCGLRLLSRDVLGGSIKAHRTETYK